MKPEGTNPWHIHGTPGEFGMARTGGLMSPAGKNPGSQQHVPDKAENPAEKAAW